MGVANPVGLLKFKAGWAPNKLGAAVLVVVVVAPYWKLPVAGCAGFNPKFG